MQYFIRGNYSCTTTLQLFYIFWENIWSLITSLIIWEQQTSRLLADKYIVYVSIFSLKMIWCIPLYKDTAVVSTIIWEDIGTDFQEQSRNSLKLKKGKMIDQKTVCVCLNTWVSKCLQCLNVGFFVHLTYSILKAHSCSLVGVFCIIKQLKIQSSWSCAGV